MNNHTTIVLVSALIRDKYNNILLLKRSTQNSSFKGCWQLPEGKLEFGEQAKDALAREIKEEIGLKLKKSHLSGVYSCPVKVNKKDYFLVRVVYEAKCSGKIKLDKEHSLAEWFTITDVLSLKPKIKGLDQVLKNID